MLTKPAGVFLQILSIPIMLVGCAEGMNAMSDGESSTVGWIVFAGGLLLLWVGGKPARRKS